MSMPKEYHLTIYRGDSYRWQYVLWLDSARTQPVDLTGVTVAAALRQSSTTTPLACTVTDNTIDVVLVPATSAALAVTSSGRWDLQLTYPTGDIKTIVAGTLTVRGDVTGTT